MNKVNRVYVEKRKDFAVEALEILNNLKVQLKLNTLNNLRVVNRYDVQGVNKRTLKEGISIILSEPMVDDVYLEDYPLNDNKAFAIEYLPGQYDQRADACEQCFQLLTGEKTVKVKCAKLIVLEGNITEDELNKIKQFLINPVDQRIASLDKVNNLEDEEVEINKVPTLDGFINLNEEELRNLVKENSLAMNYDD